MTPQQALALLDSAVSRLQLGRQDHAQLLQAVEVLKKAIEQKVGEK